MYNLPAINTSLTKSDIKIIAESCIKEIGENGGAIQACELVSKMELLLKEIKSDKDFIDFVRSEITLFGKDYKTSSGTKIELAEVGVKYNYMNCNDLEILELYEQERHLSEKIKEREAFLKTLPYTGLDIITADGEAVKIYPPSKTSTSSIKTTIAK